MADIRIDKHTDKSTKSHSSLLKSCKEVSSNVDDQSDLSWPVSEDRDSTQILKDDSTSNCSKRSYSGGSVKHCRVVKKAHLQKIPCTDDNIILFDDISNSSSPKEKDIHVNKTKNNIIDYLPTIVPELLDGAEQINYWNGLSDEIILAILSFLTRKYVVVCTKVCKRWRRLAYDETLWNSMNLTASSLSETALRRLFMRGVVVLRLAWTEVIPPLDKESLVFAGETLFNETTDQDLCYNLQYLDASSCNIQENILLESISKSKHLKNLSLESYSLSTCLLRSIGTCRQLSVLNLSMCSSITKTGLSALSKGCSSLSELNIAWTNLTSESISQVVKGFPTLIKLNLSGCRETLHNEAVVELLATCSNLISLDLSDCIVITEFCVAIIVGHGKIEELSLSRCYGISPKSLESLSSLKSLQTLQIFGFLTTAGIRVLKKDLPGIEVNGRMFSTIARPIETLYKNRIWGMRCIGHEEIYL